MNSKKTYSLVDFPAVGKLYGKYTGKSPSQAAHKAFRKLAKNIEFNDSHDGTLYLTFNIKNLETNKIYKYIGTLVELEKSVDIQIKNKSFKMTHRPVIAKYDKNMDEVFTFIKNVNDFKKM